MTLAYDLSLAAEKAFENGLSQGEHKKAIETAKSMKSEDMPVNTIARFTGLSIDEIEKL